MTWKEWQEYHFPDAVDMPICPGFAIPRRERKCHVKDVVLSLRDPCEVCREQEVPKEVEGEVDDDYRRISALYR